MHTIFHRVPRRNDDHWRDRIACPQRGEDLDASATWQHQVEHDQIEGLGAQQEKALLPRASHAHAILCVFEMLLDCLG